VLKPKDLLDLVMLGAVWGASFLFMRIAAPQVGPIGITMMRVGIAAVFLVPLLALRQGIRIPQYPARLLVLGVFNTALPFTLFAVSSLYVPAGYSAILNATAPLWGTLVAWVWFDEGITVQRTIGLVLGFAGVLVLVLGKGSIPIAAVWPALVACALATLCYGIFSNYAKRYVSHVDTLTAAAGSQLCAAVALAPVAAFTWRGGWPSMQVWSVALALGVLCTAFAYILYFRLIRNVGAARTMFVTYLIPVFGMIWGAIFLHERITPAMLLGAAVILFGVGLAAGAIRFPRARIAPSV